MRKIAENNREKKTKPQLPAAEQPSREELIDRLRKYQGMLPSDFKFDREEANSR